MLNLFPAGKNGKNKSPEFTFQMRPLTFVIPTGAGAPATAERRNLLSLSMERERDLLPIHYRATPPPEYNRAADSIGFTQT